MLVRSNVEAPILDANFTLVMVNHMTLQLSGNDSSRLQAKVAADTYTLEKVTSLPFGVEILV